MKFAVEQGIFDRLPDVCFGVVVCKGADNHRDYPEIDALLDEAIAAASQRFAGKKVKEEPAIIPYREAFRTLGINPNKYMCSAEALFTRIAKGKGMPHINPLVDLNNAVSLTHTIPMGTHDLGISDEDIVVRFARGDETFIPFGAQESEHPDAGEVIYAVGSDVRTRRWTWRQSEHGKITADTSYVFYPLDAFVDFNRDEMLAAREELAQKLQDIFHAQVRVGYVDKDQREMDLSL